MAVCNPSRADEKKTHREDPEVTPCSSLQLCFLNLSNHSTEERKSCHSSHFADEEAVAGGFVFKTEQGVSGKILKRIKALGDSLMSFLLSQIVFEFV